MYYCYLCDFCSENLTGLSYHFRIVHKLTNHHIYKCKQDKCYRSFNEFQSFRKHLKRKHSDCDSSANENNRTKSNTDTRPNITANVIEDDNSSQNICHDLPQTEPNDFKNMLNTYATSLVAKLYSYEGLPRSMTGIIINEFNNFLSSGFIDQIQNRIIYKLEELDCDINFVNETRCMFENIQNPFESLSSEYLRFKEL